MDWSKVTLKKFKVVGVAGFKKPKTLSVVNNIKAANSIANYCALYDGGGYNEVEVVLANNSEKITHVDLIGFIADDNYEGI